MPGTISKIVDVLAEVRYRPRRRIEIYRCPTSPFWRSDVRLTSLLHPVRSGQLLRAGFAQVIDGVVGLRQPGAFPAARRSTGELPDSRHRIVYCLFLIFDVEAIFLVPFAVAFTGLPVGAFVAILVFLLLLIEGLVWAWGKGCLNWAR